MSRHCNMMHCKILCVQMFFIGVAMCSPLSYNDSVHTRSQTNLPVKETSDILTNGTILKDKVQLTVYYETHYRDSVNFLVKDLRPAVLKLGSHLDVHLVPYGNPYMYEDSGNNIIVCQRGQIHCHGNMVHACVINTLRNQTLAVLFNTCLMSTAYYYTTSDITQCGLAEKVPQKSITSIINCVNGTLGSSLLKSYSEETMANGASYVPHLTFDGSADREDDGKSDLIKTVCDMLNPQPVECSHSQ